MDSADPKFLEAAARLAAIGRIAGGITHELGSPLAIIAGNVGLAKELAEALVTEGVSPESAKRLAHFFEKIEKSTNRLVDITAGLRTVAKSSDERLGVVDLHIAVEQTLGLVGEIYRKLGIRVEKELSVDKPWVIAVPGKIQQAVFHVVSNARDAVEAVSGRDRIIRIRTERLPEGLALVVTDNGCGIDPAVLPRIYEPFFSTKTAEKSCGLGLYAVQGMMKAFGGAVAVTSMPGDGSEFRLTFKASSMAPKSDD